MIFLYNKNNLPLILEPMECSLVNFRLELSLQNVCGLPLKLKKKLFRLFCCQYSNFLAEYFIVYIGNGNIFKKKIKI